MVAGLRAALNRISTRIRKRELQRKKFTEDPSAQVCENISERESDEL